MADERSISGRKPETSVPAGNQSQPERIVSGNEQGVEKKVDHALRPRSLGEMIGQERLRDKIQILVEAARLRDEPLDHVLLYGPPGLGKCITADSLILTEQGLVPFHEMLPDQMAADTYESKAQNVYGVNGIEQATQVYANGPSETLRMRTVAGFEIEGTSNHPLLVATVKGPCWKALSDLGPDDFIAIARGTNSWVAEETCHNITGTGFTETLDYETLAEVPPTILAGTGENAIRFLQHLWDIRGHTGPDDTLEFNTDSQKLAHQVQLLLANLGIIAHRTQREDTSLHSWSLSIREKEILKFHEIVGGQTSSASWQDDDYIYWDRLASIQPSYAETYDFVVPETHSFVANGLFNHNTTLSHILANEMGSNLKVTAGPAIEKAGDLAAILTNLRKGDVLFIDEIHRLGRAVEEILYPAMEDFSLNIVVGSGPGARSIQLSLPKFTIVGATTRLALITAPLRARFGVVERFDFYSTEALQEIVTRAANLMEMPIDESGAHEIARRSRGTPRVSLRLLRRVRDYAQVRAEGHINYEVAAQGLALLEIDELGLDELDRRVLDAIINKFSGGPVGLETMAASISEEGDTIMDVVEPYLLQLGFLDRTPRGRTATRAAYAHLEVPYPEKVEQGGLFK